MNSDNRSSQIDSFLKKYFISGEIVRNPLAGDASFRKYERITAENKNFILMDCPPTDKSLGKFIFVDEFLVTSGFSAPKIFARDINNGFLLLEDLGDLSFNKATKSGINEFELYKSAVDVLIRLHKIKPPDVLPHHTIRMEEEIMRFLEWYLPLFPELKKLSKNIISEYIEIWQQLFKNISPPKTICLYDYHADNLMWLPERNGFEKVGLLDFQDAVVGSATLDLAALLQDIRRDVSINVQKEMIKYFIQQSNISESEFDKSYSVWGAHWNTRILGTFARLALRDNKKRYLDFIPTVWLRLEENLKHPALSDLKKWFDKNITEELRVAKQ